MQQPVGILRTSVQWDLQSRKVHSDVPVLLSYTICKRKLVRFDFPVVRIQNERVYYVDQAHIAWSSAQSDEKSHYYQLLVGLHKGCSKSEKTPKDLCSWEVVLCPVGNISLNTCDNCALLSSISCLRVFDQDHVAGDLKHDISNFVYIATMISITINRYASSYWGQHKTGNVLTCGIYIIQSIARKIEILFHSRNIRIGYSLVSISFSQGACEVHILNAETSKYLTKKDKQAYGRTSQSNFRTSLRSTNGILTGNHLVALSRRDTKPAIVPKGCKIFWN